MARSYKKFHYFINGNLSFEPSKFEYSPQLPKAYPWMSRLGDPVGMTYGYVADGIFQSQEEIDNSPVQSFGEYRVGDIKYQDINGDGVINSQDQIAIGYTNLPEIMYGFGATAQWKNWDFKYSFKERLAQVSS